MANNDYFAGDEALSRSYDNTGHFIRVGGAGSDGNVLGGLKLTKIYTTKTIAAAGDYTAEDVVASASATGTGLSWTFSGAADAVGGSGMIVEAQVLCQTTAQVQRLTLYLFTATPTGMLDDNSANTNPVYADMANYVGRIDFNGMDDLGGISTTIATPSTNGNLPMQFICATADTALYGVLVTRDAYTNETANAVYAIKLYIAQN